MASRVAPCGTWASPLSAAGVAAGRLRLSAVQIDGSDIYWVEGRPHEAGRYGLVRRRADGLVEEVVPPGFNVRTRVHEYGGGACLVADGVVYAVNFADQRVYRVGAPGVVEPLTPAGASAQSAPEDAVNQPGASRGAAGGAPGWFYADFDIDRRRRHLVCVREDHTQEGREPVNTIVSIALDGDPLSPAQVLASGCDFYSSPRLGPDGSTLAWLSWRHPLMPWDGTELWVADRDDAGALVHARKVAGGDRESICQPGWSPDGTLYFVSDRDGWWKLYRSDRSIEPVIVNAPPDAEFGRPEWILGTATWRFAEPSRLVVSYTQRGRWRLGLVELPSGRLSELAPDVQPDEWLATTPQHVVLVAGFDASPDAVVRVDLVTGAVETIREASTLRLDPGDVSIAEPIEFPTDGDRTAHAFYYAPRNKDYAPPPGQAPPLIVISHGGPTSAAHPTFDLHVQFWTGRGFAVVDVNYGGSSGYGRAYRERLNGQWGVVDVADVINAARFLSAGGRADPDRLIIRGGSAGGYTTLAALTFHPGVFRAGASYYGVSDLEVLELDTHKFESRYSHSLIGPYPDRKALYRARSPIHAIDRLACPLILLQGLEDKVVPPNQSQMMADAVRAKGLPVAYLAFDGEQHGFRKAETIQRCLEAELYFYGKVFGFMPADRMDPVRIDNL
ncbi:MAG: S9 family peptidase [Acidobacteria bacterium]|nr:S9 family peptidase [Acidobacteriota bacterium]